MSDTTAHGTWWLGDDGRWYPPDAKPAGVRPVGSPAPAAPSAEAPLGARGPVDERPANPSAPAAPAPPLGPTGATAGSATAGPRRAPARSPAIPGFDVAPYPAAGRGRAAAPPPLRKRGRVSLAVVLVGVVAVVLGAGVGAYLLVNPSPHRSPGAVAADFVQHLAHDQFAQAEKDVVPAQRHQFGSLSQLAPVQSLATTFHGDQISPGTSRRGSGSTLATFRWCNNFLCAAGSSLPTLDVGGSWYVDLTALVNGSTP